MNKQKSQSGSAHLIIIAVLIVALVGMLSFVFWKNFIQTKNTSTDTSNSQYLSASAIITDAYNLVNNKYASNLITIKSTLGTAGSPVYKPSGSKYSLTTNTGSELSIAFVNDNIRDRINPTIATDVDNLLASNKFVKNTDSNINCGIGNFTCYYSPKVVCGESYDAVSLNNSYSLECADLLDYTSAVKVIEPFVQAFSADSYFSSYTGELVYGAPTIKNSLVAGYQNAEVSINQSVAGLFYKKDSGVWQYFTSTQNITNCDSYNTYDLKAAFSGEPCYSPADSNAHVTAN